jgi:V8-like Glu-specific endopeptidase
VTHPARLRFLATLALSLVCPLSCSSDPPAPDPVVRIGQSIMGGEDDSTDTNVVAIIITSNMGMCSGSLIAPNLILTARHCVATVPSENINCSTSTFGTQYTAKSFMVSFSQSAYGNFQAMKKVAEVYVPQESTDVCGYDMALLRLTENVGSDVAVPLTPRVDVALETGEEYKAVGYGNINDTDGAGSRRSRSGLFVSCSGDDCSGFYLDKSREWEGDTGICQGDSGGPALDTKNRIVGVVSRGAKGCTMPIYGSVYAWSDWIMQIAAEAAKAGNYEPAPWVTGGSTEPVPDAGPDTEAPDSGPKLGGPGTACSLASECDSNLCVFEDEKNPSTYYCSAWCTTDTECPAKWYCANGACYQHGGFGDTCAAPTDCRSNLCVSDDGKAWYCTTACSEQQPCPTGSTCSEKGICFKGTAADTGGGSTGGCAIAASSGGSGRAWALWALALIAARRRRTRASA